MDRREFLQLLAAAGVCGMLPNASAAHSDIYQFANFGDVRLLHITDTHAQLNPVYFREPHVNLGFADAFGRAPHLVGRALLDEFGLTPNSLETYAFTYLDFTELSEKFGKAGGYAHLKTLVDRLRGEFGHERTLLLDGGDSWQGSGPALWSRGMDMIRANNKLGVDIATGHWEFTYEPAQVMSNLAAFSGEFVAQNIFLTEEALFDEKPVYDEFTGHAFPPYTLKTLGGYDVAVIGQAFPYTPIANPIRNVPDWSFGIRADELQELIERIRADDNPDAIVLLSHNGFDVDMKLAGIVDGLDFIMGGHTHDAVPGALAVKNSGGTTYVTNAGSNAKFVGVLDLKLGHKGVQDFRYRLVPVMANYLEPDAAMQALIDEMHAPYADQLGEELAWTDSLLFRRGNFNGTFDEVICNALQKMGDAQIALSPGFRWGTSILPGQAITMQDVLNQTATTYPETYVREMSGETLKLILEDVADNSFNPDPFYQQGGDMVRLTGMSYTIEPEGTFGTRISDMRLESGELIDANRNYSVAGWATVGEVSPGPPVWEVVADYLRQEQTIRVDNLALPKIVLKQKNPGMGSWSLKS